jgi:F-type H+-transporting ATPase subunit delta
MKISKHARQLSRQLFRGSFVDGRLDHATVASLVQSLITNKPRDYVSVLQEFKRYLRLELERRQAIIETAVELDEKSQRQVRDQLTARYGDDIETIFKLNSDLIGGIRIKLGSDVWDGSVRGRLQRLEEEFTRP